MYSTPFEPRRLATVFCGCGSMWVISMTFAYSHIHHCRFDSAKPNRWTWSFLRTLTVRLVECLRILDHHDYIHCLLSFASSWSNTCCDLCPYLSNLERESLKSQENGGLLSPPVATIHSKSLLPKVFHSMKLLSNLWTSILSLNLSNLKRELLKPQENGLPLSPLVITYLPKAHLAKFLPSLKHLSNLRASIFSLFPFHLISSAAMNEG